MMLLSACYLPPVSYVARLYAACRSDEAVTIDLAEHYQKQTYRNRCCIAAADGPLALSIPVEGMPKAAGGTSHTPMADIRVSDHGRWRSLHWRALVAAYESSPFFDYYADDLERLYATPFTFLADLNAAFLHTVLDNLDLHPRLTAHRGAYIAAAEPDLRRIISPKMPLSADAAYRSVPYYQVFADRLGFLPNLSIIDLLCCMGPEARLILRDSLRSEA